MKTLSELNLGLVFIAVMRKDWIICVHNMIEMYANKNTAFLGA